MSVRRTTNLKSIEGGTTSEERPELSLKLRKELELLYDASFTWAMNCCGFDRALAQDVLQEAYLKILEGKAQFGGRSSFKTWLFSVIQITAKNDRRRGTIRELILKKWFPSLIPSTEHKTDLNEELTPAQLLAGLSEQQTKVMELVFFHDMTLAEAAQVMGISMGSASQHYERAKRILRKRFSDERDAA